MDKVATSVSGLFLFLALNFGPGITALIALGILESAQEQEIIKPLSELEHNSAEYLHVLVEALR